MKTKNNPPTHYHENADRCPNCGSYVDLDTDLDDNDYCNDCREEPDSLVMDIPKIRNRFSPIVNYFTMVQNLRTETDPEKRAVIQKMIDDQVDQCLKECELIVKELRKDY